MIKQFYRGCLVRKCFGQNFLNDQKIINDIVEIVNPQKKQAMVEIGPGLAALTKPFGKHLDHLTVIELDRNLAIRLQDNQFFKSKLTVYQKDAMTMDFDKLSRELGQPLRIFGNLPYNISTSLILYLFKYINVIVDMHFMLQKEVANRLIAKPGSKAYGRLSIIAQYYCQMFLVLEVPPSAFIPSPKVNSAMIRFVPQTTPYPLTDINMLSFITRKAFNQRRKIIRNSLSNLLTNDSLRILDIDSNMRSEDISVLKYCQISNYISDKILQKNE